MIPTKELGIVLLTKTKEFKAFFEKESDYENEIHV